MKNNDLAIWEKEFKMYAKGNRRINIISDYIRDSDQIRTFLDVGCNKCLIGALNPDLDYYVVDWIMTEESKKFKTEIYDINSEKDMPFEIKFDAIAMSGILEYAKDPFSLLNRVASQIKPDGLLFISYVNFNYISRLVRKSLNIKTYLHPTWKNTLDFQLLRSMFDDVDLHVEKEMSVDLPMTHFGLHKYMGKRIFEKDFGDALSKQKLFILKKGGVSE